MKGRVEDMEGFLRKNEEPMEEFSPEAEHQRASQNSQPEEDLHREEVIPPREDDEQPLKGISSDVPIGPSAVVQSKALPSQNQNCEDPSKLSQTSGSSSSVRHYNLRSHSKKSATLQIVPESVGGLCPESSKSISKKGRGRKSLLSKAQAKAKFDVADGKQMSIPGVLRAAKTPEMVIK